MLSGLAASANPEFHKHLYYVVKQSVRTELVSQLDRDFGLKREKLLEFFFAFFSASGWGLFENKDANFSEKRAIVSVQNAPFASLFPYKSSFPVDSFLRGIIAGIFCVVFDSDVDCVETSCSAMGESFCSFVVKPLHDFDFSNKTVMLQLEPG